MSKNDRNQSGPIDVQGKTGSQKSSFKDFSKQHPDKTNGNLGSTSQQNVKPDKDASTDY